MPNLKISQMPAAAGLTGTELVELVQSGVNVQSTAAAIAALGGGGGGVGTNLPAVLTANQTYQNNVVLTAVPGMTVNVVAPAYYALDGVLLFYASAASNGSINFDWGASTCTIGANGFTFVSDQVITNGAPSSSLSNTGFTLTTATPVAGNIPQSTNVGWLRFAGSFKTSGAGTLALRASQSGSNAAITTLLANSYFNLIRLA